MRYKLRKPKHPTVFSNRVWRILPRTVIGIAWALSMLTVGAGLGVLTLYTRFDFQLDQLEDSTFEALAETTAAQQSYGEGLSERQEALDGVLDNFTESVADPATIGKLSNLMKDTVVEIKTEDIEGNSITLSGVVFAVDTEENTTFVVTSSALMEASKALPAPVIKVVYSFGTSFATLETWDDSKDLALIKVSGVQLTPADWASIDARQNSWGDVAYVASGYSSQETLVVPSRVVDYSQSALRFLGPVANEQAGGAIVNGYGEVLGVVTRFWNPSGSDAPHMPYAATRETICESSVASC